MKYVMICALSGFATVTGNPNWKLAKEAISHLLRKNLNQLIYILSSEVYTHAFWVSEINGWIST